MTLLNLHMFMEIVKDMNLCQTAQRLFTTQQGLSGHIKRLESHFGVALFTRNPHLVLTEEGKILLQEAKSILETEQKLFRQFGTRNNENFGNLRISCGMARSRYYMPKIISEFTTLYPSVSINLFDENSLREHDAFGEDKIDIALGRPFKSFSGLKTLSLLELHSYIMLSDTIIKKTLGDKADDFINKASKGIEVGEIPLSVPMAYAGNNRREPWLCEVIPELKDRPRVYVEQENYDILIGLCREGKVMIILSEMYKHYIESSFSPRYYENTYFFPHFLNGKRFVVHEVLSYNSNKYHPKYFYDFLDIIIKTFDTLQKEFHKP
ncbi:MAG: LysR family transcriptional regulator [Spirochaetales bacterium]|nr:LysR family transcriptional regulator [Spirochaetales bacterium]